MAVGVLLAALLFLLFPAKVFAAFTLENITPTEISSEDQELTLFVNASNLKVSPQYLQAAFTKEGKTSYFGKTQTNSGDWHAYESSPPSLDSLLHMDLIDGSWNGEVKAKLDTSSSAFAGPGTYLVKLWKHTASSKDDSNTLPITVSFAAATQTSSSPAESSSPEITFSLPGNLVVGQEFDLPFVLKNFPAGSYYIKARIGEDSSALTKGQTYNNAWLTDTDAWSKFPQISGSSTIKVRLNPSAPGGDYKIKLSVKKGDDSPIVSSDQSITFKANPNPPVSPTKTPPSSPTPKAPSAVLALATAKLASSSSPVIASYAGQEINLGTKSAKSKITKFKDLLIKSKNEAEFPVSSVAIGLGIALLGGSLLFIFRKKIFNLSQDE